MADVELQEQSVPLKAAEQVEGAESAAGGEQQQAQAEGAGAGEPKAKEKKGGWFSKKKTTKTEVVTIKTTENAEPGTDGEGGQNNVNEKQKSASKKCPFSFCRTQKCAATGEGQEGEDQHQQDGQQPSFQYNMVQRDDRKLQESIDLGVEQIFGEPDAVHSLNGIWKTTLTVFVAVRNFIYKFLSLIFAIPLAVVFGVLFGLVSVLSVYVFVPVGRLLAIPFSWLAKVWSIVVSAVLDPVCRSCGLAFGNVNIRRYGINQDPTAVITA